eukprot:6494516-Prymnesium_polylepis.3
MYPERSMSSRLNSCATKRSTSASEHSKRSRRASLSIPAHQGGRQQELYEGVEGTTRMRAGRESSARRHATSLRSTGGATTGARENSALSMTPFRLMSYMSNKSLE